MSSEDFIVLEANKDLQKKKEDEWCDFLLLIGP